MKSAVFYYKHDTIILATNSFVGSNKLKEKIAYENITRCNNESELLCSTFKERQKRKHTPAMGIVAQASQYFLEWSSEMPEHGLFGKLSTIL